MLESVLALLIISLIPMNEEYIGLRVSLLFYQAIPCTKLKKEDNLDLTKHKRKQIPENFPLPADFHVSLVTSEG